MKTIALKMPVKLSATALVALVACSLTLSSCGDKKEKEKEDQAAEQQEQAVDNPVVETLPLQKGKLTSNIQVPGELAPYQQVDLYAKIASYVKELKVDVGSEVHTGQVLMTLDAPEINSQLAEAKARIAQQQAAYAASKSNYDRLVNTAKTPGTIAQNDVDQAAAKKDADYANIEAAKSFYKQISANLEYLVIRAPFDGVITARNVNIGAYVGPSGSGSAQPVLVLQQQSKMRLIVSIPEAYTGGLSNKDEVSFTVRSMPNEEFTAKVVRLSGALDTRLRSEHLEMDVYNKSKKLLPGMTAEVNVPLPSRDSSFIVPKAAVVRSTEKVFIVKVDDNHHAKWIDVKPGLEDGSGQIEVFGKGLKAGDKILTKATDEIRDGMPLRDKPASKDEAKGDDE